jgi:hypothetical protein
MNILIVIFALAASAATSKGSPLNMEVNTTMIDLGTINVEGYGTVHIVGSSWSAEHTQVCILQVNLIYVHLFAYDIYY